ncbi:MAG: hypothetical protein ACYDAG_05050, partial [Chloroflexota bacterium]
MIALLKVLAAKLTAGWGAYILIGVAASGVTAGGVFVVAQTGMTVLQTSGETALPFSFQPPTLLVNVRDLYAPAP